ncbi:MULTISPECIES: conjugal transfer protein TraG N-terminal domain-containing protein [unclassified Pseudoalteromonas]|uniref:conjugal transfer protein TraG N-terminal domain-containing protein n=1 Tax=unclassified Pseudoalteromonas TaxID=194690 RepID=UPI001F41E697|nr:MULTISPECIES: conjugal transfer protein TraG N-terminal domain-containing protein [unclassified Pseudoalteromonas]MCF2829606.1 conjugal transfer protein TraG N-terminal domain-containing protein [Pseudoalteromonas sp. OF5H-5]MCF2830862.1 conjugal transfer protein TraG N-terminal domain-containing protein [Pseudoalteromonas sp. DL2-H6]MCF2927310.1 conjugal transfer protein TraG N-terminal domain-containing protein [Pseudoalteromonas sp. DL2-H1]
MTFTSLSDLYFFATGVYALNTITDIAISTKLIVAPVIVFIVTQLIKAFEGDEEAKVAILNKLEIGIYMQMFVFLVAFYPMVPLKVDSFQLYSKQCEGYKQPEINNGFFKENGPAKDLGVLLSNNELRIPLIIGLARAYGTGFSIEAVDSLPCGFNLTGARNTLLNSRIADTALRIETKEFIKQCYQPALNRALRQGDKNMPWIDDPRTDAQPWPGHNSFMNNAYYGNIGNGFYSQVLLPGWQGARTNKNIPKWSESQQAESNGEIDSNGGQCIHQVGGFPSCREWWQGIGAGYGGISVSSNDMSLRKRLWDSMPEDDKSSIWALLQVSYHDVSDTWYEDKLMEKAYFSKVAMHRIQGAETRDYGLQSEGFWGTAGNWFNRLMGTAGNIVSTVPDYAEASLVQSAAPMIKGAAILILLAAFPLVLMVSQYSIKMATTVGALFVSIQFWPFFWELTIVFQKAFIQTVANSSSVPVVDVLTQPNVMMNSQRITDMMFIAFPFILTSLLTYAGLGLGGAIGSFQGMSKGAGSAGRSGGDAARKVGGKVARKAASKGAG